MSSFLLDSNPTGSVQVGPQDRDTLLVVAQGFPYTT